MLDIKVEFNSDVFNQLMDTLDQRIEKCGQLVENTAKENCPVDKGILRASINHTDVENHSTTIGTDIEYAVVVHEGHGKYQGVPFLQDAANLHIGEIKDILGGGL